GVAVGCGARGPRRGGGAAGPDHVLDDDRLPERAAHVVADDAGNDVRRPAGGKRHDQRDRALRIVGLRHRRARGQAERGGGEPAPATAYDPWSFPHLWIVFLSSIDVRMLSPRGGHCCLRAVITCRSRSVAAPPPIRRRLRRGAGGFWVARQGSAE